MCLYVALSEPFGAREGAIAGLGEALWARHGLWRSARAAGLRLVHPKCHIHHSLNAVIRMNLLHFSPGAARERAIYLILRPA